VHVVIGGGGLGGSGGIGGGDESECGHTQYLGDGISYGSQSLSPQ
jgi:hypothetical protein